MLQHWMKARPSGAGTAPFDLLATQVVPFELGWSLLSAEYGANVKKRATSARL